MEEYVHIYKWNGKDADFVTFTEDEGFRFFESEEELVDSLSKLPVAHEYSHQAVEFPADKSGEIDYMTKKEIVELREKATQARVARMNRIHDKDLSDFFDIDVSNYEERTEFRGGRKYPWELLNSSGEE